MAALSRPFGSDDRFVVASELGWTVFVAVWVVLPAYVPNSVAVLVGGGPPIDGGRTWRGIRVLGDGKTWRGALGGSIAGFSLALLMNSIRPIITTSLPAFPFPATVALPVGAMLGDVIGSFLKRRMGRERGSPMPILDQLGFIIGALVLSLVLAPAWTTATFTPAIILVVLVVTPLLHLGTNGAAFLMGLKDEPW